MADRTQNRYLATFELGISSQEPIAHDKSIHALKVSPRMLATKLVTRVDVMPRISWYARTICVLTIHSIKVFYIQRVLKENFPKHIILLLGKFRSCAGFKGQRWRFCLPIVRKNKDIYHAMCINRRGERQLAECHEFHFVTSLASFLLCNWQCEQWQQTSFKLLC